jgi:hypothetical protein
MENTLSTSVIPPSFIDSSMNVLFRQVPSEVRSNDLENSPNVKILDGDNKVDVEIEPDVKNNTTKIQLCSCSIIFNCFTRNTMSKN